MRRPVSGGTANLAGGQFSSISGGFENLASGLRSSVGGGGNNPATGVDSVVGGGVGNIAAGNGQFLPWLLLIDLMEAPGVRHNVIELLVPVRSGQTQMAVEMLQALSSRWAAEHHAAAREHGLLHLSWYLAVLPGGAYILAHVEGIAPQRAIGNMLNADAPFTTWLRRQLSEVSGFRIDAASIQHLTHAPLVLVASELPEPQLGGAAKRSSH